VEQFALAPPCFLSESGLVRLGAARSFQPGSRAVPAAKEETSRHPRVRSLHLAWELCNRTAKCPLIRTRAPTCRTGTSGLGQGPTAAYVEELSRLAIAAGKEQLDCRTRRTTRCLHLRGCAVQCLSSPLFAILSRPQLLLYAFVQ
jgi:hypothetical protein